MSSPPWLSQGQLGVLGTGAALPGSPIGTEVLIEMMADRFGFTRSREARTIARLLAIDTRHGCRPFEARAETPRDGQSNPELAARAVQAALADAGMTVSDLGYLVGHTATPAQPLPANIAVVADVLGYGGPHIELRQACTGFANALMIAFGLLAASGGRPVAIVGSETGSLFFDPALLNAQAGQIVNLVQMGDGAGAIILGRAADGALLHGAWFGSIGLDRSPGIQRRHGEHVFDHDFTAIRQSGRLLFEAGRDAAIRQGCAPETADRIIPHQVSGRIGQQLSNHFGLSAERMFVNADRIGNTGSAAIWLALAELRASGLKRGSRVLSLGAEASKYMHGGFIYDHA